MALDPQTPVIVGVGQLTRRPPLAPTPEAVRELGEPIDMMEESLRRAGEDSGAGATLLERAQRLAVVALMSHHYLNPAALLALRLGCRPKDLVLSATGGNTPQALMDETCADIAAGRLDVALITGAEAFYTRRMARQLGVDLAWTVQADDVAPPRLFGMDKPGTSEDEMAVGLMMPVQIYPMFENAIRSARGASLEAHQQKIARLWSRFSDVAAGNPHAWSPVPRSPEEIGRPGPDNRMVGFPYPKYMNSNIQVDQAAAVVVCSVEAARSAGVPEDRWVFPRSGAEANDHWFVSERDDLHSSPAIRLAGQRALALDGGTIDDIDHVDLYSCFPSAVQMGAEALGIPLEDANRPLTVTGGLPFGGGPGNNYVTHSIATMCTRLRSDPGSLGLVTALGWYATKHAVGLYSTRPPSSGFRWENVQAEVDALPRREATRQATGAARIETYTVMHDRQGQPERATVTALLDDGRRALANVADADQMSELTRTEGCGRAIRLLGEGRAELV